MLLLVSETGNSIVPYGVACECETGNCRISYGFACVCGPCCKQVIRGKLLHSTSAANFTSWLTAASRYPSQIWLFVTKTLELISGFTCSYSKEIFTGEVRGLLLFINNDCF